MKKITFTIFLSMILLVTCQKKELKKIPTLFGNYQIINSPQKEWFVHSDIASWQEYNNLHQYRNDFDIIWYSPTDFDLIYSRSTFRKSKYHSGDRVECKLKILGSDNILSKNLNNVKVKAVLKPSNPKKISQWFSLPDKNFSGFSSQALSQLWTLKQKKYEAFYSASALDTQLSLEVFLSIQNQLHSMFGGMLWFRALAESFQQNNLGYAMDFQVGMASAKLPLIYHFQWNKAFRVVSLSVQSGKANQSAWVNEKFKQFWQSAKNGNWRPIYQQATDKFKKYTNYDEFARKMSVLTKLESAKMVHLSSCEIDLAIYGNNWAYFFEVVKQNTWMGINFIQHFQDKTFHLNKIVYID